MSARHALVPLTALLALLAAHGCAPARPCTCDDAVPPSADGPYCPGSPVGGAPAAVPARPPCRPLPPLPTVTPGGPGQEETLHGQLVRDPFRWLEDETKAQPWIGAQNRYTDEVLGAVTAPGLKARLTKLFQTGSLSRPVLKGDRLFYTAREGDEEQPRLVVREAGTTRDLLNLNTLDPTGKTALDWYHPSRDGALIAYGLSRDGSENSTLYVLDVATGKNREGEAIPDTRHGSVAWLPDASGFYYTRYPPGDMYNRHAYFHQLGTRWEDDPKVFGEGRAKVDWPMVQLSEDGQHLIVLVYRGFSKADVYLQERATKAWTTICAQRDVLFGAAEMVDGTLYLLTNLNAPRWRYVAVDPATPDAPETWRTVIPEGDWPIEGAGLAGGKIVVETLELATSRLAVYGLDGALQRKIALPGLGTLYGLSGSWDNPRVVYGYLSFFYPPTLFRLDLQAADSAPATLAQVTSDFPVDRYTVTQVEYPSYDGTLVPMFLIHKKDLPRTGDHPTLLIGYGGFNISYVPRFSAWRLAWLELGGMYAVANLRGGGERGETWHQAGMRGNKHQVFRDFEYAMRYLQREGYTSPDRLALYGGSNGGLLLGAMLTGFPHLFRAAVSSVGLYDMVRYHKFPPGLDWADEYGNPDEAADFAWLHGYSPYHQVVPGVRYPAAYIDTAASDTRVHWNHSAKFVAALQAANASDRPVLFRLFTQVGHGQGMGLTDRIRDYDEKFRFLIWQLGMTLPGEGEQ